MSIKRRSAGAQPEEPDPSAAGVTSLLHRMASDPAAADRALRALMPQLKRIARRKLRGQSPGHSLVTTDLVHEAFLKLNERSSAWSSRSHYLAVASFAMRSILVDHARARRRLKRGGPSARRIALDETLERYEEKGYDLVEIEDLLVRLAEDDPIGAALVTLIFHGGADLKSAAGILGLPLRTAERRWAAVRSRIRDWLAGRRRPPKRAPGGSRRPTPVPKRPSPRDRPQRIAELLLRIYKLLAQRSRVQEALTEAVRELCDLMRDESEDPDTRPASETGGSSDTDAGSGARVRAASGGRPRGR